MDDKFIIDSVKMDLRRIAHWTCDISTEFPEKKVLVFLTNAKNLIKTVSVSSDKYGLAQELSNLTVQKDVLIDPLKRLRWAEEVLTLSCRL